ncbi:MAG: hypothetical protein P8Y14_06745 [Anaerolineales bacterium]
MMKKREDAIIGLSGVKGDGVRRKNSRGTWETRPGVSRPREDITGRRT